LSSEYLVPERNSQVLEDRLDFAVPFSDGPVKRKDESNIEPEALQSDG
jgi:hypothetical protein